MTWLKLRRHSALLHSLNKLSVWRCPACRKASDSARRSSANATHLIPDSVGSDHWRMAARQTSRRNRTPFWVGRSIGRVRLRQLAPERTSWEGSRAFSLTALEQVGFLSKRTSAPTSDRNSLTGLQGVLKTPMHKEGQNGLSHIFYNKRSDDPRICLCVWWGGFLLIRKPKREICLRIQDVVGASKRLNSICLRPLVSLYAKNFPEIELTNADTDVYWDSPHTNFS